MTRTIPDLIADAILNAKTDQERRERASACVAYGLGLLAAMDGDKAAAETGYRLADALASRKPEPTETNMTDRDRTQ